MARKTRAPDDEPSAPDPSAAFVSRWAKADASERGNFQSFAVELCDLLGVDRPSPTGDAYRFE